MLLESLLLYCSGLTPRSFRLKSNTRSRLQKCTASSTRLRLPSRKLPEYCERFTAQLNLAQRSAPVKIAHYIARVNLFLFVSLRCGAMVMVFTISNPSLLAIQREVLVRGFPRLQRLRTDGPCPPSISHSCLTLGLPHVAVVSKEQCTVHWCKKNQFYLGPENPGNPIQRDLRAYPWPPPQQLW